MLYHKDITASTNLDARTGKPGDVFTADYQTAGRGRLDHAWLSSAGMNLMFSIVLSASSRSASEIATLPLVVGLSVVKTFDSAFPIPDSRFLLKWPNDIFAEGRKLCGILCERIGDNVIAGVGVNVNQTAFRADLASRATSLAALSGHPVDRVWLRDALVSSIVAHHARWLADGFAALHGEFAPFDMLRGKPVSVLATDGDEKPISGICGGIQTDGTLMVGSVNVWAGEAHIL